MKKFIRPAVRSTLDQGFTLIELLLYVAMIGVLLTSVVGFFGVAVDARVKDETIADVNNQGNAVMDYLTRTVRNASSVVSPAIGATGANLALNVSTAAISPTSFGLSSSVTLGYPTDGGTTGTSDSNNINTTKFVASASGTLSTLYIYTGATIDTSPHNLGQAAIYSGATQPTTLLASSTATTLSPSSWNAFSIAPVAITSGTTYWLAYNTNGTTTAANAFRYVAAPSGTSRFISQTYGAWPASFSGTVASYQISFYGMIDVASATGSMQTKENNAAYVPLTSNDVVISNLSFKNLGRSGTQGVIQISFTANRLNPAGKNEYDYAQNFISSAEVAW